MIIKYCLICISLCAISSIDAQDADIATADSLFNAQQYFESSISYERVLFQNNANWQVNYQCVTGKLNCLKKQCKFKEAVTFIGDYLNQGMPDSILPKLLYEQALCSYLAKNYENTVSLNDQVSNTYPHYPGIPNLRLLKILSLDELQHWDEAKTNYAAFVKDYYKGLAPLPNLYEKFPHLKSENKAQWLSTLIPGAGQIYAGKPLEGLASITIQGVAIYFAIISWEEKYYISAWLGGVGIFGSFHSGGVRRAEYLVKEYNAKKIQGFNAAIKGQLVKILNR